MGYIFSLIYAALGVYLIYGAISGKSGFLKGKNVKKGNEDKYRKTAKLGIIGVGIPLILLSIVMVLVVLAKDDSELISVYNVINNALIGILLIALTVTYTLLTRLKDKKGAKQASHTAPRAAFIFDEEEKATDSKKTKNRAK